MLRQLIFFVILAIQSTNTFAAFFFFGDSLSDSGYQNNNPTVEQLGKTPLWTSPNGHTWVYYFLQNYKQHHPEADTFLQSNNKDAAYYFHPVPNFINPILDGNNFAAGGSTTKGNGLLNNRNYKSPSLLQQIDYFVNTYSFEHNIIATENEYFIWSGGNDLMKELVIKLIIDKVLHKLFLDRLAANLHTFSLQSMSAGFSKVEHNIANNIFVAVKTLQQAHAKKIVVILIPDLGKTPLIKNLVEKLQKEGRNITVAQLSAQMSLVTKRTNALIREGLKNSDVVIVDVNRVFDRLTAMHTPANFTEDPQEFGKLNIFFIANNKDAACKATEVALTCIPKIPNAKHYVFEDFGHPTDQTHQIIGDYIYYQTSK